MDIRKLLTRGVVTLDGAMGTELMKAGLSPGSCPEAVNIDNPEAVTAIHRAYIESGAEIIFTNTFGSNRQKLKEYGLNPAAVIQAGVKCAKDAGGSAYIALDIGPIGQLVEPLGRLSPIDCYDYFSEMAIFGQEAGADCIWLETFTDLYEAKIAVLAVKEHSHLPVLCSMSFDADGRTFLGASIECCAATISGLSVDGFGVNCAIGANECAGFAERIARVTDKPIIVKPNAGVPEAGAGAYNDIRSSDTPTRFAAMMEKAIKAGAALVGGCCGTTPAHIRALSDVVLNYQFARRKPFKRVCAVCSSGVYLPIDKALVIGERINPTGKKKAQLALRERDYDYFVKLAAEQARAGASLLDVNVGLPGIAEPKAMIDVVDELRALDMPLVIDSSNLEALDRGLRHVCGKPILNSVNGDDAALEQILPIAKKYGAAIIGLTMDGRGMPKTALERVMIAERIIDVAAGYGIPKEDVFIDCLTLTCATSAKEAYETINAIRTVNRIGVKTVLGVSNISFGLPARHEMNRAFLAFALANGLDMPIINPQAKGVMETIVCYNTLRGFIATDDYVRTFCAATQEAAPVEGERALSLAECVRSGMRKLSAQAVEALIAGGMEPMDIINNELMPTLDEVGRNYESGVIYLPQLLTSSEAAKAAFKVINARLPKTREGAGKIILATVAGDVHDIGKNIVKAVLENYGYTIIDLGKDVAISDVASAAILEGAKLVGLSTLMTTTVENMAKTVADIKERTRGVRVMIGGAVVTAPYAESIGADYYGKDALEAVRIAKEVYGGGRK